MFILKIVTDFSSAHSLRDYPGDCANMHGHNWKVEVLVSSKELDESGMVIDFRKIKQQTKKVISKLDHRYLNEVKPFDKVNPTAENLAKYLYEEIDKNITNDKVIVYKVIVWENSRYSASYQK
jgi:6-pyruvoyltetrahydropterin/6-carboxytetrahydropterin synthase